MVYAAWILVNLGTIPGLPRFDPSFVILATEASVEAIFLSTFVLISQNRTAASSDKRADLDLHISLLTEHELTKLTEVVTAIAARLEVPLSNRAELDEIQRDVAPEAVLRSGSRRAARSDEACRGGRSTVGRGSSTDPRDQAVLRDLQVVPSWIRRTRHGGSGDARSVRASAWLISGRKPASRGTDLWRHGRAR